MEDLSAWQWGGLSATARLPPSAVSVAACKLAQIHGCTEQWIRHQDEKEWAHSDTLGAFTHKEVPTAEQLNESFSMHCADSIKLLKGMGVQLPCQLEALCLALAVPDSLALKQFLESELENRSAAVLCHGDLNPGMIRHALCLFAIYLTML